MSGGVALARLRRLLNSDGGGADDLSPERLALMHEYGDWLWEPRHTGGAFDSGAPGPVEVGLRLHGEFVMRRWLARSP